MFHLRLIELESELLAKEQSQKVLADLPYECLILLEQVEKEVGIKLAQKVPKDWRGWLSYRRHKTSLVICRGRAFSDSGMFANKWKAGLDVPYGLDTVTEYERRFDVTPPQDLDHLLLNFGAGEDPKVFLWYGENLAPYKLIFLTDVLDDPEKDLAEAVVEACTWILTRPKEKTLQEFLKEIEQKHTGGAQSS